MKIIALITQKGGAGKSTLATSLAVAAMQAGEQAIAFDLDPQGTLTEWGKLRQKPQPAIAHLPTNQLGQLPELLQTAAKSHSWAILDTQGADTPSTHSAMKIADFCLVPLRPTRPDALGIRPTIDALIRGHKQFAFILNQCPTGSRNSRANEMAAGLISLGVLAEPMICLRADYQDAFAAGEGVTEYAPSGKAAEEIRGLWKWTDAEVRKNELKK